MDYVKKFLGKNVAVKMDRKMGTIHPSHGFVYPVNYGFVPGTLAPDNEEVDAYVLGVFKPLEEFAGKCIAVIHRINDNDDKLIVVPDGVDFSKDQIVALTEFQERFFKSKVIKKKSLF
jgi:inorganic pyrophosphatase